MLAPNLVLLAWIPITLLMFQSFKPRHAVLASYILGWMFLPEYALQFPGIPDLTKMSVTAIAVIIGSMIFDPGKLHRIDFKWYDAPVFIFAVVSPFMSSVTNGLGAYDGVSEVVRSAALWLLPYLVGRQYLGSKEGLKDVAIAIFWGGMIYIPFCLWEVRLSPQLHAQLYGFHQHSFAQTVRGGGFRPMVFMEHGLMVGLWMANATLIGVWLWTNKIVKRVWRIPIQYAVPLLMVTTVLCKSAGSMILLIVGVAGLFALRHFNTKAAMIALLVAAPIYCAVRVTGAWDGAQAINAAMMISPHRAASLRFRLENEELLVAHGMNRPAFGWGGHQRSFTENEEGKLTVPDGLWILMLSSRGLVGLTTLLLTVLLPVLFMMGSQRVSQMLRQDAAPAVVLTMMLLIYMLDNLVNAMQNPIYIMAGGGLCSFATNTVSRRPRREVPAVDPYDVDDDHEYADEYEDEDEDVTADAGANEYENEDATADADKYEEDHENYPQDQTPDDSSNPPR